MSLGGGHGVHFFMFELVAAVPELTNPSESIVMYPLLEEAGETIHAFVGADLLSIALILHIAGALKHHVVDKDRTLLRMVGK